MGRLQTFDYEAQVWQRVYTSFENIATKGNVQ